MEAFINNILSYGKLLVFLLLILVLYFLSSIEPFYSLNSFDYEEMTVEQAIAQARKTKHTIVKLTDAVVDCNSIWQTSETSSSRHGFTNPPQLHHNMLISNPERTIFIMGIYTSYTDNTSVRPSESDPPIPCTKGEQGLLPNYPVQGTMLSVKGRGNSERLLRDGLFLGKETEFQLQGNDGVEFIYINLGISSTLLFFVILGLYGVGKYGKARTNTFLNKKNKVGKVR